MAKEGERLGFAGGQSIATLLFHGGLDEVAHGTGASRVDDLLPGRRASQAKFAHFDLQLPIVQRSFVFDADRLKDGSHRFMHLFSGPIIKTELCTDARNMFLDAVRAQSMFLASGRFKKIGITRLNIHGNYISENAYEGGKLLFEAVRDSKLGSNGLLQIGLAAHDLVPRH